MNQPALESPEADPELLRALVGQYVDHHRRVESYVLPFSIACWPVRRLGLDPRRWPGHLAAGVVHSLLILLPALILTALTGQWADAPLLAWVIVALAYGANAVVGIALYSQAIVNLLSWLGTIVDEADLRRLAAWERRLYSHRLFIPVSGALTLGLAVPLLLVLRGSAVPVPAGTLYICVFLIFLIMQNATGMVMVPFEARNLSTCRYELYRLSPADSVLIRRSNRGYNQLGAANVLIATVNILFFLVLLPSGSGLVALFVVSLLLLALVYTALVNLLPRVILGHIIRTRKEEEMAILQRQLNDLLPRIREVTELTEEEHTEMKRLQETQDAIRNSPDSLLSLGALFRATFAVLLSVLTVLATVFAREWLGALMTRFAR